MDRFRDGNSEDIGGYGMILVDMGGYGWIWEDMPDMGGYLRIWEEDMRGYLWIWGDIGGYSRILVDFHRFREWRLQQARETLKIQVWKAVRSDRPNL